MKIAIASGKGGTGKTTVSTNLAAFWAMEESVVLTDLDVEEPNSGLFIKGQEKHKEDKYTMVPQWDETACSNCGQCVQNCNFNAISQMADTIMVFPQLCHSCYACSELCPSNALPMQPQKIGELTHFANKGYDFIESKLNIGQEMAVPLISQTIEYLEKEFGNTATILLDSPPGTACPVIEATKDADLVLLVTEPTPFGLNDLKLAVETMRKLKKEFAVIINRHGLGNDDVENYCTKEGITIAAKIPNQRQIAELYSKGELLFDRVPEVKEALTEIRKFIRMKAKA